ncbi:hypothetical protein R84981_002797 [Carnimonas sp. R-84981]
MNPDRDGFKYFCKSAIWFKEIHSTLSGFYRCYKETFVTSFYGSFVKQAMVREVGDIGTRISGTKRFKNFEDCFWRNSIWVMQSGSFKNSFLKTFIQSHADLLWLLSVETKR